MNPTNEEAMAAFNLLIKAAEKYLNTLDEIARQPVTEKLQAAANVVSAKLGATAPAPESASEAELPVETEADA